MTLPLNDILSSLPVATDREERADDALRHLMTELSGQVVPTGVVRRLWTLGTMQAKIAAAYLAYWIRASYASADERERLLNETHLNAAIKLLGGMSYLRGIIMKAGQMLAAYPKIAPPEFVDALGHLHFEAPPMHFALLREQVRRELGGEVDEVFAEFDTRAFAAASLGQVHRARLHSGEAVAVKVQYPAIAETIRSDYRAMLALLTPMRLTRDWDNLRAQLDDARRMVESETDYLREAENMRRARVAFAPHEGIVIPKVVEECSTRRVLTMEWLDGVHLDRYLASNPSQEERDRYGALMMRASFRIAHAARLWYADSHPGNYLFLRDGRLGVLDFGCCREFTEEEWDYYIEMGRAHMAGEPEMRRALKRGIGLAPDDPLDEEYMKLLIAHATWYCDYLKHEGPFDFGDDAFVQRGIHLTGEIIRQGKLRSLPVNTWIFRQLLGLRAIAYRLRARIDMKRLNEEESQGVFV